jgi:methylase of polypeptide subunit release factors
MKTFEWNNKKTGDFKFYLDDNTFIPTQTTSAITEAAIETINTSSKVLDLGCGCGIVAILLSKNLPFTLDLYASDLSDTVEEIVNMNAAKHNVEIDVRKSDIFETWYGFKFNTIINDISGVAEEVAKISPWFDNISCDSGAGGDKLINKVLKQSPDFLHDNGKLIFPIISFSNENEILKAANKIYGSVRLLKKDFWPAPKELSDNIALLKSLKKEGLVSFDEKFGTVVGYTSVYEASL